MNGEGHGHFVEARFEFEKTVLWIPVPEMGLLTKHFAQHARDFLKLDNDNEGIMVCDMTGSTPLRGSEWVRPTDTVMLRRTYTLHRNSGPTPAASVDALPTVLSCVEGTWGTVHIETIVLPSLQALAVLVVSETNLRGRHYVKTETKSLRVYEAVESTADAELRAAVDGIRAVLLDDGVSVPETLHVYQPSTLVGCLIKYHRRDGVKVGDDETSKFAAELLRLTSRAKCVAYHYCAQPWLRRWAMREFRKMKSQTQ